MAKVIWMDISRCINCKSCEVACEREHDGRANMFVQVIDERFAVPLNCRHCAENPCVTVCPTGAVHRESEDAITIAPMMCIGCGMCRLACPFGAIWEDTLNKIARKCDLCLHRLSQGLEPACVATCSARALVFGEYNDLLEKARKRGLHTVVNRAAGEHGTIVSIPAAWSGVIPVER